jgi:hypothetical protein
MPYAFLNLLKNSVNQTGFQIVEALIVRVWLFFLHESKENTRAWVSK